MRWTVTLSKEAVRQLSELPRKHQDTVRRDLEEMAVEPFRGLVKALQGKKYKGLYRQVSGRYRIIFSIRHSAHAVDVLAILLRNERTYR